MPKLDDALRISRIQERLDQLERGDELEARDINALLTKEQQQTLKDAWAEQQLLRKQKKPATLDAYEQLHKQVAVLLGKCLSAPTRTPAEQRTLLGLQQKLIASVNAAQNELDAQLKRNVELTVWLDRPAATAIAEVVLQSESAAQIEDNNAKLKNICTQLPILVTSRSDDKLVSEQERFSWKSIRDLRIELYRQVLTELKGGMVKAEQERLQRTEVRAARVFMDAFAKANKEGKDGRTHGNNALRRNGFNRLDGQDNGVTKRDKEVWAMEEAIGAAQESELSDYEREQLEMSREYEKARGKRQKE